MKIDEDLRKMNFYELDEDFEKYEDLRNIRRSQVELAYRIKLRETLNSYMDAGIVWIKSG